MFIWVGIKPNIAPSIHDRLAKIEQTRKQSALFYLERRTFNVFDNLVLVGVRKQVQRGEEKRAETKTALEGNNQALRYDQLVVAKVSKGQSPDMRKSAKEESYLRIPGETAEEQYEIANSTHVSEHFRMTWDRRR